MYKISVNEYPDTYNLNDLGIKSFKKLYNSRFRYKMLINYLKI